MDEENAAPFIPDDELTDLEEAKRRLRVLRSLYHSMVAHLEPSGRHVVFLSPEYYEMAQWLYEQGKLAHEQDPEEEYEEAFEEFVEGALEVFYDMARYEKRQEAGTPRRPPMA
jgi:hypothetical protein